MAGGGVGVTTKVRIVGAGRAGGAFALALRRAGWNVDGPIGRDHAAIEAAADGVDLVLVCVSDPAIAEVASTIRPGDAVVAHVAGAVGLDVLAPHRRVGAIHPLVSLPSAELGAERLVGAWYGTGGDPIVWEVARALRGRSFRISAVSPTTPQLVSQRIISSPCWVRSNGSQRRSAPRSTPISTWPRPSSRTFAPWERPRR